MHIPIVLSVFRPACIAPTVAIRLHDYWAVYDPPLDLPVYTPYNIDTNNILLTLPPFTSFAASLVRYRNYQRDRVVMNSRPYEYRHYTHTYSYYDPFFFGAPYMGMGGYHYGWGAYGVFWP